jgi:hypothetical protein
MHEKSSSRLEDPTVIMEKSNFTQIEVQDVPFPAKVRKIIKEPNQN